MRRVVDTERPSGLTRVHGGAEALMVGLGSQCGGRRQLQAVVQHGCSAVAEAEEQSEWREVEGERRVNRGLTQLDLNFCVETRKTVNIKVVGNSRIYNFRVGPKFI